jgi:hypothetical protein
MIMRITRGLLYLCAPTEHVDAIIGDLTEEHCGADLWLASQALRSVVPLLIARWRRGELAGLIAVSMVTILAPLRLADLLWAFVHSQVPLKADLHWSAGIWIVNLLIAICGAALLGYHARNLRTAAALAILALGCAGMSVAMSTGHPPLWYIAALGCLLGCVIPCAHFVRRRSALS